MRVVYKYELEAKDEIQMVKGGKPLAVASAGPGRIFVWVEHEVAGLEERGKHLYRIFGTGHNIPQTAWDYVGTVQDGFFVWHVYIWNEALKEKRATEG